MTAEWAAMEDATELLLAVHDLRAARERLLRKLALWEARERLLRQEAAATTAARAARFLASPRRPAMPGKGVRRSPESQAPPVAEQLVLCCTAPRSVPVRPPAKLSAAPEVLVSPP
jgi:hypothetical protein